MFNIEMFNEKNVKKIKDLYCEFVSLRKHVKKYETQYNIQNTIKQQLKMDVKNI